MGFYVPGIWWRPRRIRQCRPCRLLEESDAIKIFNEKMLHDLFCIDWNWGAAELWQSCLHEKTRTIANAFTFVLESLGVSSVLVETKNLRLMVSELSNVWSYSSAGTRVIVAHIDNTPKSQTNWWNAYHSQCFSSAFGTNLFTRCMELISCWG